MRGFFDRLRESVNPIDATASKSGRLMEAALTCFRVNNWKCRLSDPRNVLRFCFAGKNANFEGILVVEEDAEQILVLLQAPNKVPESRRLAVADLLTRANYGMKFGAFEMDFSDGEVRFKISTILREGQLSPQMVGAMIGISLSMLDTHYPALMGVCFGNQLPSDAAEAIRNRQCEKQ